MTRLGIGLEMAASFSSMPACAGASVEQQIESFRCERAAAKRAMLSFLIKALIFCLGIYVIGFALNVGAVKLGLMSALTSRWANVCGIHVLLNCFSVPFDGLIRETYLERTMMERPWLQVAWAGCFAFLHMTLSVASWSVAFFGIGLCHIVLFFALCTRRLQWGTSWAVFCIAFFFIGQAAYSLELSLFPSKQAMDHYPPNGPEASSYHYLLGSALLIGVIANLLCWRWQRIRFRLSAGECGCNSSGALTNFVFSCYVTYGIVLVFCGLYVFFNDKLQRTFYDDGFSYYIVIAMGVAWILAGFPLVANGAIHRFLWQRFDSAQAEQDGAFMAQMLTDQKVSKGMTWWVHHGMDDDCFSLFDARRNWTKCRVEDVIDDAFVVAEVHPRSSRLGRRSSSGRVEHRVSMLNRMVRATDLLAMARQNMRCIDWKTLTPQIMSGKICGSGIMANMFDKSRAVRYGEMVDYFMSHSWHDDADVKWHLLTGVADRFRKRLGRYPTFWLDKVCVDQNNIADGLRVLPIYVVACSQMLVLCGPTYPERLWCAWELCTLFSFMRDEQALERVELVPFPDDPASDALGPLSQFDVDLAHCYNPNVETIIFKVIDAVGKSRFNDRIRRVAAAWKREGSAPTLPKS